MKLDVHLGTAMENRIRQLGMSKAEFARRMHVERQTVNAWWSKDSFDVKLLLRAGEVLEFNFVDLLIEHPADQTVPPAERFLLLVEVDRSRRDTLLKQIS